MDLEKAKETIIEFIRQKAEEAGVSGAVVGISGGIDSALIATLAVQALGPDNVLGIHLPETGMTPEADSEDSKALAKGLGIEFRMIDISKIFEAFLTAFPESKAADRLSKGNLKARIRMSALYFHANHLNRLVLGTGNKTEILIGYYTKYGDGGVDLEPIGDLYKTEVWELARKLGVPDSIINKKPSAGLWSGQTDEADLGISYETLDKVLRLLEEERSPEEIAEKIGISKEQILSIRQRIRNNMHKREVPPTAQLNLKNLKSTFPT
ncbi:MAG: NAD+ synthase [Methanosarcinaceae archaeon]|nr:NAD+ synthase [Methanosarcinaceae archaeon]MDD4498502.1 NAD+ synthase [Methanosarcinaceae archaeon]